MFVVVELQYLRVLDHHHGLDLSAIEIDVDNDTRVDQFVQWLENKTLRTIDDIHRSLKRIHQSIRRAQFDLPHLWTLHQRVNHAYE